MEMYATLCVLYNQSSIDYYHEYKSLLDEINTLAGGNSSWDYWSHRPEENAKFDELAYRVRRNSVSTIVFQALAIESYLNLFGKYNLGDRFDEKYERKPTYKKLCLLCKDVTGSEFPKDELYDDIMELFEKRHFLVHYKSNSIDVKNTSDSEFYDFLYKNVVSAFSNIEKYTGVYNRLRERLKRLSGVEFDVIEQQIIAHQEEMSKTILEMLL